MEKVKFVRDGKQKSRRLLVLELDAEFVVRDLISNLFGHKLIHFFVLQPKAISGKTEILNMRFKHLTEVCLFFTLINFLHA